MRAFQIGFTNTVAEQTSGAKPTDQAFTHAEFLPLVKAASRLNKRTREFADGGIYHLFEAEVTLEGIGRVQLRALASVLGTDNIVEATSRLNQVDPCLAWSWADPRSKDMLLLGRL